MTARSTCGVDESFSLPAERGGVDFFSSPFLPASANDDERSWRSFRQIIISLSDTTVFSVGHFYTTAAEQLRYRQFMIYRRMYVGQIIIPLDNLTLLTPSPAQTEIRPSVPIQCIRHKPPSDKSDKLPKAEVRSQHSVLVKARREGRME